MSRSLALSLYLATRRGGAPASMTFRPPGPVVWLQLSAATDLAPALVLARRLSADPRPGQPVPAVVIVCPPELVPAPAAPDRDTGAETGGETGLDRGAGVLWQPFPRDTPAAARALLEHWRPGAVVIFGADLPPALIVEAASRRLPLSLVNVAAPLLPDRPWRRLGGMTASLLRRFDRIVAQDQATARALRRAGVPPWRLEVGGPMADAPEPLPHNEAERETLARQLRGRPCWLAAAVPEGEEALVLAAHGQALRYSHRLLLVLVPDRPDRGVALRDAILGAGSVGTLLPGHRLSVALRSEEGEPLEDVQVYIADTEGELGLWYRLAPVSYLGGSLRGPEPRRHPLEAPTLGSVLLHGPVRGRYGNAIARLTAAGASRAVARGEEIHTALGELLEPERTARRAHAGWNAVTAGAEITDRIAEMVMAELRDISQPGKATGTTP